MTLSYLLRRAVNLIQERLRKKAYRDYYNRLLIFFLPAKLPLIGQARLYLELLQAEGNTRIPNELLNIEPEFLRKKLEFLPCYDPWAKISTTFEFQNTPDNVNNARIKGVDTLKEVVAIANNPLILSIVSNYLGCKPTIDDIVAWWSLPGRPLPKEEQLFHRDSDASKFVKFFIYLSEVEKADGAHVFVTRSHKTDDLIEPRKRYTDEEVLAVVDSERIIHLDGGLGTAFLEDTRGIHKGTVPASTPRLVLQIRYTSFPSVWAGPVRRRKDYVYDEYVNRHLAGSE